MPTQISQRQVQDGAINNAKVQAGAAIDTSKLAEGVDFIKRTGAIAFTADQSFGGFKATNVGTPVATTDVANKNYVDTQIASLSSLFTSKDSVRAATTGNVTIANPGTSTFDTVSLSPGDRLFVRTQSAPAENGIYVFNGSGVPLTRATDFDAWAEIPGALFPIEEGSVYGDVLFLITSNTPGGVLGTTAITSTQLPTSAGLLNTNFVTRETPTGAINGANTTFTLANTPVAGTEEGHLNGLLQEVGGGNDYTISGNIVTMVVAPLTGEKLTFSYRK